MNAWDDKGIKKASKLFRELVADANSTTHMENDMYSPEWYRDEVVKNYDKKFEELMNLLGVLHHE